MERVVGSEEESEPPQSGGLIRTQGDQDTAHLLRRKVPPCQSKTYPDDCVEPYVED